ncbi:unnamed protein product, partial [Rotaria magnacalcarata]
MSGLIYMWNFRLMCGCGFWYVSTFETSSFFHFLIVDCFNYEDHRWVSFNLRVPTA